MPAVLPAVLVEKLQDAMPAASVSTGDPMEARIPRLGNARIYLRTVTHVKTTKRPEDEYKMQLMRRGQGRRRGHLTVSGRPTFLLGYAPDFSVFVGWEARRHATFGFSATVQIKEATLEEARRTGWAVERARNDEVRVAFNPANLFHYLELTIQADRVRKSGVFREAFFVFHTPNQRPASMPKNKTDVQAELNKVRGERLVRRIERDRKFSGEINKQFGFACAICGTQLKIVDGAHIIPVNVQGSTDRIWNGLALCPNHHRLFDTFAFTIAPDLTIKLQMQTIERLQKSKRNGGVKAALIKFGDQRLRPPSFFQRDRMLTRKMQDALRWHAKYSGHRLEAAGV